jgi:hypothetical protein
VSVRDEPASSHAWDSPGISAPRGASASPNLDQADLASQVRSLIAAAEATAGEVTREARSQATAILEEADREADRRTREARREADALVAERRHRIAELSDAIVARAESALAELERAGTARTALDGALRSLAAAADALAQQGQGGSAHRGSPDLRPLAGGRVESGERPEPTQTREPPEAIARSLTPELSQPPTRPPLHEPAPSQRFEPAPRRAPNRSQAPELVDELTGAELVAHQMAQAGSDRGEVAAHLARTFALRDPERVLNAVFANGDPPR